MRHKGEKIPFSFEHVGISILQASSSPVLPGHVVSMLAKANTMPGVGCGGGSVPPCLSALRVPRAGGGEDLVPTSPQYSDWHPRGSLLN